MAATKEPVILSWSGGKDSSLALSALREDPALQVVALLTTVTPAYDRISIHGVRRALLDAQSRSLGLPVHEIVLEPGSSNEAYDAAVEHTMRDLRVRYPEVHRVAYGDLFLHDVRAYREERISKLGFECLFPIWGRPTDALAREFVDRGFEARLVCVDTTQLDPRFAGRAFDHAFLDELSPDVDPCGERGEFHTFVSNGPGFERAIDYELGETVLRDGRFMYADLLPR